MSKNKILFHYSRLNIGGAERSILKLANLLASEDWEVTMVLNVGNGKLETKLHNNIKVVHFFPKPWKLLVMSQPNLFKKVLYLIRYIVPILWFTLISFVKKQFFHFRNYDAAVISLQGLDPTFVCKYVKSNKKYLYLRSDLTPLKKNKIKKNIIQFNDQLDGYLCVSQTVKDSLDSINTTYKNKAHVLYNIVDIEEITALAEVENPYKKLRKPSIPILVTVCRMSDVSKALFRQLEAAQLLKKKGLQFNWFFVGSGPDLNEFKDKIVQKDLSDCIFSVGEKKNPYPYIKNADIACVLSNYEGLSGVVNESKFLGRTLIATEFSGINEQIIHKKNGLIVPQDLTKIVDGLEQLITNKELRLSIQNNFLGSGIGENKLKVEKLKKIISA